MVHAQWSTEQRHLVKTVIQITEHSAFVTHLGTSVYLQTLHTLKRVMSDSKANWSQNVFYINLVALQVIYATATCAKNFQ